ncbi:Sugar lactone lactonase YvrE [Quadrisphaera granulorum]|uniref:Sugar lactone lactonase YvrE n=1 Tax=Quadrisphaera granulorum TaxID=317664 RepID=A0A316A5I3_9ACTN|nr:SMP-30/gluconolactonase/LRE family protein [Quadrisphaera granulorum]PWJ52789.1 sugar lactone lactonase YvrE [Quadrisphaera granulorum]SZE97394.1 Sugar lactone lactonase YvrE [Quadrisphaera granulorum]
MPTAEQLTEPIAEHGEGPVWDDDGGRLLAVDLEQGDLLAVSPQGDVRTRHIDDVLACVRPRREGGWVLAARRQFAVVSSIEELLAGREEPQMLPPLWDDPDLRFNEGGCDPQGRFFCGSMAYGGSAKGGQPVGALWRLDGDGSARVALGGLTIPNGLGWSPDGQRAYHVDSPSGEIALLHVAPETGEVLDREPWVRLSDALGDAADGADGATGVPDGLVVDAEGGVWVAVYGAGVVLRFDASGALSERVDIGVPAVTACTLGGTGEGEAGTRGGSVLYVTTSTQGVDLAAHPGSGAVFVLPVEVAALPPLRYDG